MVNRADVNVDQTKLRAETAPKLQRFANKVARDIRDEAKRIVPVRTGRLRASIHVDRERQMSLQMQYHAQVTAGARYAVFVHQGTRPHIIRTRHAKALHFQWRGREVFVKSVHHPGTRARPFLAVAGNTVAARYRI